MKMEDHIASLNENEKRCAVKFLDEQNQKSGKDGKLLFNYAMTGIGTAITVTHSITKASKDVTDYTCW